MAFFWKRPRASRLAGKKLLSKQSSRIELTIPTHFRCPISLDLMKDPVTLSTGITYDRESIEKWIRDGNQTCPVTNQVLTNFDQIPNHMIRRMIQDWCVENRAHGVERIPTPRTPITSYDIMEICSKMMAAASKGDAKRCLDLVEKINVWAKESEQNKSLIKDNGLGYVLAASFEAFSSLSFENHEDLLKEILLLLTWMFPLGVEGRSKLGSTQSLRCMTWLLSVDDLLLKKSCVLTLKELLSTDQTHVNTLVDIDGAPEALINLINAPDSHSIKKTSFSVIYHILSTQIGHNKLSPRFLELGVVELSLEALVEADKGLSEMALGVLDRISDSKEGREKVQKHALSVPLLVKKILRVSSLATDFCVSMLWKFSKNGDGSALVEALHVGAFQKLLLMLQVNCGEETKVKATEMLKLMNQYKNKLECFDSGHYKYLRKSY
ncbi:putative U box domain, armadillo-like helical, Zinc finger, RING/FYVE/PHD-type [Helianthus annuus]|nr:putative U box domain, armadillo-like helical, Zinc finger, RING/FYVE/PHD-type [Helianthus annuus]KAJ0485976.1 putative U box domain, armadillo-like helical, Zinc finger, RING/FYVE/PHD-type [Helianthus annuus]KAJ0656531.1 putative U box domain, armadillo-like helical, Zinc finger, RING/FYVE/PHD-type [Helianthus annuus]KAJ0660141.1 putative U box domain, armadillo-like helical, Zinc finger, RING/FYVE/PHD-type [Helianthus annuus]KAJ0854015.1 putative U box domain, armadillo-like helical, Zinc 